MNILVTGATGFIGKNLITKLDGNIFTVSRNHGDLVDFMTNNSIEGVIHLASCFISEHETEQVEDIINSNILFSTKVIEAASKTNVKWFINTVSFWQHYNNEDYCPVNLYAATKQAFEIIAKYYIETSNLNFVTIKLCDTYGPNDTRKKIFHLWEEIAKTGNSIDMSPGEQLIDITHVDDVVDAYINLIDILKNDLTKENNGKDFAVSSGKPIPLKELASKFEKVNNVKLNINWGARPYRNREVMKPWNKGNPIKGWRPKVTLEKGMKCIN